jgi:predicted esterase
MTSENSIHTFDHPGIVYSGPPLSSGPLPALFYFALSAQDSLCLDPFNQPVSYLSSLPMRVFSITLPGHENNLPPTQALNFWAKEIAHQHNIIAEFIETIRLAVETLLHQNVLIKDRIAIAGLSRGAFIATHAAAAIAHFRWILGFAPLTTLSFAKEFQELHHDPLVNSLSLTHLTPHLIDRTLRYYIGNLDARVSTRLCFDFVETLAQTACDHQIRSPQVELIISPSIGRDGHGTAREIFHHGAQWIAEKLGAVDVL